MMSPLEIIAQGADNFNSLHVQAMEYAADRGITARRAQSWWDDANHRYYISHGACNKKNIVLYEGCAHRFANNLRTRGSVLNIAVMKTTDKYLNKKW